MDIKGPIVILICIVAGLLTIVGLGTSLGGNWQTIAGSIAPISVMVVLFAIVVGVIYKLIR